MREVRIAIAGLGRVGSVFLQKITEHKSSGIKIVGLMEARPEAPGVRIAEKEKLKVFGDIQDIVNLGASVDVIFDLTGSTEVRKALRSGLAETNNRHTVVAPEVIAFLIWGLIASGETLPDSHVLKGY